jgi:hypothetical protein
LARTARTVGKRGGTITAADGQEQPASFNLACYLTAKASEAEDLVQETYARALSAGALFRGGSVKAWLFQILGGSTWHSNLVDEIFSNSWA